MRMVRSEEIIKACDELIEMRKDAFRVYYKLLAKLFEQKREKVNDR